MPECTTSYKGKLELMDEYIKKNLVEKPLSKCADMLTFDSFLKVYKTALIWNRVKFQKKHKEIVAKRREALKANDMTAYRMACIQMQMEDTKCLQDVIEEVLEQTGINEKEFQACLELFLTDEEKKPLIKEALDDAREDY